MIKCDKCGIAADGMLFMSGLSSFSDMPLCCVCMSGHNLLNNTYLSFESLANIVDRHRMEKIVPWRGPMEDE